MKHNPATIRREFMGPTPPPLSFLTAPVTKNTRKIYLGNKHLRRDLWRRMYVSIICRKVRRFGREFDTLNKGSGPPANIKKNGSFRATSSSNATGFWLIFSPYVINTCGMRQITQNLHVYFIMTFS